MSNRRCWTTVMTMAMATWLSFTMAAPQTRSPDFPPASLIELTAAKHQICVGETGVSEDTIGRFNAGPDIVDDDEPLKCYMDCMFRQFNVVGPDGQLDMIDVYHAIPKQWNSEALKVWNKCRGIAGEGSTQCERAFSHHKCWKQTDPEHYYLF